MHDARVPTIQILRTGILYRDITQDCLESRDGLDVVCHFEIAFDDGNEVWGAVSADVGGDDEVAALWCACDEIAGFGGGWGEATFDACQ